MKFFNATIQIKKASDAELLIVGLGCSYWRPVGKG